VPDQALQDGRFLMLDVLGRGGMGSVYGAFDRLDRRMVALKVAGEAGRFGPAHPLAEEFETWSRLEHPNIVAAYEMREAASGPLGPGTPYLVLEHVAGGPAHRVLAPGRRDDRTVLDVAEQVLSALAHVHAAGIVHRDLKPANVLVPWDARRAAVKLTDFGLAAPMGHSRPPGIFSGSLPYVAPEALLGGPLDGRADLYGLGVLLYRLLTGELPMDGADPESILSWHVSGPPADPSRVCPRVPERLARFIRRLTARAPAERPDSALEALELIGAPPPASRPAPSRSERASLRLALDAARLGAVRTLRLDGLDRETRRALARQAAVWAQVRGVRFYRLAPAGTSLDAARRLALGLLAEDGPAALESLRRHRLRQPLSLEMIGDVALTAACPADAGRAGPPVEREAGRRLAAFLLERAAVRSLVLWIDADPETDALAAALARGVARARVPAGGPRRGGLLVVLSGPDPA